MARTKQTQPESNPSLTIKSDIPLKKVSILIYYRMLNLVPCAV